MGVVFLTWPIFVRATVDLEKILSPHAASWDQYGRRRTTVFGMKAHYVQMMDL